MLQFFYKKGRQVAGAGLSATGHPAERSKIKNNQIHQRYGQLQVETGIVSLVQLTHGQYNQQAVQGQFNQAVHFKRYISSKTCGIVCQQG